MITQEYLKSILHYNPETGIFTWLVRPLSTFKTAGGWRRWNNRYSDTIAGAKQGNHRCLYIKIGTNGKGRFAHRLAFLYMIGSIPEAVDHINHKTMDNRWVNLRSATFKINSKNISMRPSNTSGFNGVHFSKSRNKWQAQIGVHGKNINLGRFDLLVDAVSARKLANKKYGFHPNHGL